MSTQSPARFLIETPPWCPTVECWQHGDGAEHHVEGCPFYGTLASEMHHFMHAVGGARQALLPHAEELRAMFTSTWRGRLTYWWMRIRGRWPL